MKLLAKWLRKLADFIDSPYDPITWDWFEKEIDKAETLPGTSGEYKKHIVLAAGIKKFPHMRQKDIYYLIEYILQGK